MSPTRRLDTPAPSLTVMLPSGPVPVPVSAAKPVGVGTLAHLVIGLLAPSVEGSPERIADSCLTLAHELAAPSPRSRGNAVLAAGFAVEYLRLLRPVPPWTVLGVEYDTGAGRVDLAYRNPRTRAVFFDEVKTTHVPLVQPSREWIQQTRRYSAAGVAEFGSRFAGTRLLPLGSRHLTALVAGDGQIVSVTPSPDEPLRRAVS